MLSVASADLVITSREQADALCLRILETSDAATGSIDTELKEVCHTLAVLDQALRDTQADQATGL